MSGRILKIMLSGCGLALAACQPGAVASQPLNCDAPGTVTALEVAPTARGYPYRAEVYLPPCYDSQPERLYPVVYLVPGRGSGPGAWFAAGAHTVADDLVLDGEVPPFIIVATENTDSDAYADAIFGDLLPYVDSHYRVQADRRHRAAAGGSLGGVAAYRLAFGHPEHFASAGMFGSGLISGEEPQLEAWLGALEPHTTPRVFLNSGESDVFMVQRAEAMVAMLDRAGVENTAIFSPGDHTYAYWVSNFAAYVRWAAEDWAP